MLMVIIIQYNDKKQQIASSLATQGGTPTVSQTWAWFALICIDNVKPIFEEFNSERLLKECFHGKIQNRNEAFNGTIWERLPKSS